MLKWSFEAIDSSVSLDSFALAETEEAERVEVFPPDSPRDVVDFNFEDDERDDDWEDVREDDPWDEFLDNLGIEPPKVLLTVDRWSKVEAKKRKILGGAK